MEKPIESSVGRAIRSLIALAVIAGVVFGVILSSFPSRKNELDFSEFYAAGQMVWQGLGRSLYDPTTQTPFQSRVAAVHTLYNHPPFEALLFIPLTFFGYRVAYSIWTVFGVILLFWAALLIERRTNVSLAISQYARMHADFGLVLIVFVTFGPATTCLLMGQDSMLLMLIYTLAFVLLKRGADFRAGCVLACGLFRFQLVIPFAVILLLRRRWSALKGFAAIATMLILASSAVSGLAVFVSYPRFLLGFTSPEIGARFMPNVRGGVYVLTNGRLPGFIFGPLVAILSVAALGWAAANWRDEQFGLSFSASLIATLLASYHLYNYDVTLILLPVSIICGELAQRGRLLSAPAALTGALIVLFTPPLHMVLVSHGIYSLMCIPILVLFFTVVQLIRSAGTRRPASLVASPGVQGLA